VAEGQFGERVDIDLVAQIEVRVAVVQLGVERIDEESVVPPFEKLPNAPPRSTCEPMSFDSDSV
jgi:hypothetical protein